MNRLLRYILFGLCVVLLQTWLVPYTGIFGQRPDLVVVFALIAGAYEGSARGSLAGFIVGLLVDIYHPPTLGAGTMAGTVVGYIGGRAQVLLDMDHVVNQMVAFGVAHLLHDLVYSVVASLQGAGSLLNLFFGRAVGGAVYTALLGTLVLSTIGALRGRKHVIDRRR